MDQDKTEIIVKRGKWVLRVEIAPEESFNLDCVLQTIAEQYKRKFNQ